jgi:hypothetical protein
VERQVSFRLECRYTSWSNSRFCKERWAACPNQTELFLATVATASAVVILMRRSVTASANEPSRDRC